jgi:DNA-binding NarL/FixJ family response regulator
MSIRIAIADDHPILVVALQTALAIEPDFAVIGTAHHGAGLLDLVAREKPDVVVMDIGMPGMNGIEATQRVTSRNPATKVVVLSAYDDRHFVLEAIRAGAAGYVVKSSATEELPRAIRAAAHGQTYLCPEVAGIVADAARAGSGAHARPPVSALAPRERVIVRLLAEGKTSAQVAQELHIAVSTADTHRRNIMRKLGTHNVADITRYAIREGIVRP